MAKILKFTSKKPYNSQLQKQNNLQLKPLENSELYQRRAHSRENLLLGGEKGKKMTDYEFVNNNLDNNDSNPNNNSSANPGNGNDNITVTIARKNSGDLLRLVTIWLIQIICFVLVVNRLIKRVRSLTLIELLYLKH